MTSQNLYVVDAFASPCPYLVSRTSCKNELAVGVEAQTVDLSCVSVDRVAGLRIVVGPSVPSDEDEGRSDQFLGNKACEIEQIYLDKFFLSTKPVNTLL